MNDYSLTGSQWYRLGLLGLAVCGYLITMWFLAVAR